jgi:glutathione S-transferase
MNIKLAVFDFCPYCQRVRILLEHYRLPHEVIPIDPEQPPAWFSAASPRGKVPLLMVDDTPILESAVIGEFINEISRGQLLAAEPIARARIRAWVELVSGCQVSFGAMMRAPDEHAFLSAREALHADLAYVDQSLDEEGPFFGGDALCMVDIVFAPLLTRMLMLDPVLSCFPQDRPKPRRLAEALAALPEVDRSVGGDLSSAFTSMVKHLAPKGYVASHWCPA